MSAATDTDRIKFKVNGVEYSVGPELSCTTSLLTYLRKYLELRGTKYMCLEGGCGACIVAVSKYPGSPIQAVNSCLVFVTSCQGWEITTIEKVGNRLTGYHPLQKTLAENNGTQCGYCSPGFVMSMYSLLKTRNLTMLEIEKSLGSNTCRCTGYRPILDAFKKFASDAPKSELPDIEDLKICKNNSEICSKEECDESDFCFVSKDQLLLTPLHIPLGDGHHWYVVQEISDVFAILRGKGDRSYMFIAGNTAKGVVPRDEYPDILIDISRVHELKGYLIDQNLVLGAGNTITETIEIFNNLANQQYLSYLKVFAEHLTSVAHIPVRNLGTLAGNLMIKYYNNEFPSDIFLLLNAVGAQIKILTGPKHIKILTMEGFLKECMIGKMIVNILLPPLSNEYKLVTYKITPRSQNAHAIVNAGFLYRLAQDSRVLQCSIVYGGLSPIITRAINTERCLLGKKLFTNETLQYAVSILKNELIVTERPPEYSAIYRKQLAISLFYKGLLSICPADTLGRRYKSGAVNLHNARPVSDGRQIFDTSPALWPLNQPIPKVEALIQTAGEARFTEDLPSLPREVYAAFALSTVPSGKIENIDASHALQMPGVIAFYSAKDIPSINSFTPAGTIVTPNNEEILCDGEIKYFNQPVGIVVAETQDTAEVASRLLRVKYSNLRKPVIDVKSASKDAKRSTLFMAFNAKETGNDVMRVIKGEIVIYGQYHFCMETLACVSQPTEEGMEVYSTTQWMDTIQFMSSRVLNIPQNKIDVHVRRIGGGYGYKISRATQVAMACNLVVHKLNRPCRFIQSLRTNMRAVGKRLPCYANFEIAVNKEGGIQYINYDLYEDNGYIFNEPLVAFTLSVYSNCYNNMRWNYKAYNVVTDTPSNTWCRSPGTLEAVAMAELMMEQIAYEMSLDPLQVRLANLDTVQHDAIREMIEKLKADSQFMERRVAVDQFNKENRWKKRGLRFACMRWEPFSPPVYLDINLSVYSGDGTVSITHGGVEMGQGINTKAVQICAYLLKIPIEKVKVKANNTTSCPNTFISGASITSQNVGTGIQKCCNELLDRLQPVREQMDNPTWEALILKAFQDGIDLQSHGFVNITDNQVYSVYGVALAEVEIDILTGECEILRVDLSEDVGRSVSPEIDVGQIEGAFIMGLGYWTSERLVYDENSGELLTDRTWEYWVPQANDIPQDFRVYFRKKSYSNDILLGSKATGEPATCLGVVVPIAIREAIVAARIESGISTTNWFKIDGPYTVESICLAAATRLEDFKFY